jgi:glycosyltransferase involved in cell wall biosynthesis
MGMKSPNPKVPLMDMAVKAKALAEQLGILHSHVFFQEDWVAYEERANYLLDADIAVSAHFDLIETRLSFRTRILDYFWAGLPILTTAGDDLADLIQSEGAGSALSFEDADAWASAIIELLSDEGKAKGCHQASAALGERFQWSNTAIPLKRFCADPYHPPSFTRVKMPSLLERARAVYSRGGKEMVLARSKELLGDLLR